MNRDVFIGSSQESEAIAISISEELKSRKIKPRLWREEFPLGTFTLTRLLELSRLVDGAVFVFGDDDETWYHGNKASTARDNVMLEWGIFVSWLGTKRCIVFCRKGVRLPTDLAGLTNAIDGLDGSAATKVANDLINEFKNESISASGEAFIVSDIRLGMIQIAPSLPYDWLLRGFYLGLDGAKAWLAASGDPVYKNNSAEEKLRCCILSRLNTLGFSFRTFVSLGPGDGRLDEDICMRLKRDEPSILYIPVDISDGLLIGVCAALQSKVSIRVGLLADFEGHFDFVASNIKRHGKSPILYGLLGGTFGNLDGNEHRFLSGLINSMSIDDVFLFDVAVDKGTSVPPNVHMMSEGRKRFYSHGASRVLGVNRDKIFENFDEYVDTELGDSPSDVPGTKVVIFKIKPPHGEKCFAYMRRYTLDNLTDWLKNTFGVDVETAEFPSDAPFGRALLTIRKRV